MAGLVPFVGLLVSFAAIWLLARGWSESLAPGRGWLRANGFALVLLAAAIVLWVAAYGALRGSVIALCVLGGVAVPVALILEFGKSRA
jgi:hypothetical protein